MMSGGLVTSGVTGVMEESMDVDMDEAWGGETRVLPRHSEAWAAMVVQRVKTSSATVASWSDGLEYLPSSSLVVAYTW